MIADNNDNQAEKKTTQMQLVLADKQIQQVGQERSAGAFA
jgi:hypothetical protein